MTILGWIICVVLLIGYFTFVIWALVLDLNLFNQVNSRLPEGKKLSFLGSGRSLDPWRQYKILFPAGKLHKRSLVLSVAGTVCLFGAIATAYLFHLSVTK